MTTPAPPRSSNQRDRWATIGLLLIIGGSSILLLLFALLSFLVDLNNPDNADRFVLLPACLGSGVAGLGAMVLVALRQRLSVSWLATLGSLFLWITGSFLFSFGGSAIFLYEEPGEFIPFLTVSLGFCLVPGFIMAALGLILYWWNGYQREKAQQAATGQAVVWQQLKEEGD